MISALFLFLGVIGLGLVDYFYRSTQSNRDRNQFNSNWSTFLFILVAVWESTYWHRTQEIVALARTLLALLGSGIAFCSRNNRLGKRSRIFYGEFAASWIGFSIALTLSRDNFLILFLGWEWGWFWFIRLVGFYHKIPENRLFTRILFGISFLTSILIGFGLYGIYYSWGGALAAFCFLVGWTFRLGIVPFYFWGFHAINISFVGLFFTSVIFIAQSFIGFEIDSRVKQLDMVIQQSWERGLLFLSVGNLFISTLFLFWQRSLKQWLFFLYLLQAGWFMFLLSQPRTWMDADFCILVVTLNLGFWAILLKIAYYKGRDSLLDFMGLMDHSYFLGISFSIFIIILMGLFVRNSLIFLFHSRLGYIMATITFFSLMACFQMLKKIVIRKVEVDKFKLDWSEKLFFLLLIGILFFGVQRLVNLGLQSDVDKKLVYSPR